jgi:hypothetical protein
VLAFLDGMGEHIQKMTAEQFANHHEAYRTTLLEVETPKTLRAERTIFWNEITSGPAVLVYPPALLHAVLLHRGRGARPLYIRPTVVYYVGSVRLYLLTMGRTSAAAATGTYMFDRATVTKMMLDTISQADLLEFYNLYLAPGAPERREIWIQIHPAPKKADDVQAAEERGSGGGDEPVAEAPHAEMEEMKSPEVPEITDAHDFRRAHSYFGLPVPVQHTVVKQPHL